MLVLSRRALSRRGRRRRCRRVRGRLRGKDTLGRYSGNKFGIVLTNCTPDDMAIAADRLLAGVRDELVITDDDGRFFRYNPRNEESRRIQEALFHEKQTIIENCLFGVDINPNSVKICRLRLWIELLKNAYYKEDTNFKELETLPNIDINIKCGNSLLSRYPIDADLSKALKSIKYDPF